MSATRRAGRSSSFARLTLTDLACERRAMVPSPPWRRLPQPHADRVPIGNVIDVEFEEVPAAKPRERAHPFFIFLAAFVMASLALWGMWILPMLFLWLLNT